MGVRNGERWMGEAGARETTSKVTWDWRRGRSKEEMDVGEPVRLGDLWMLGFGGRQSQGLFLEQDWLIHWTIYLVQISWKSHRWEGPWLRPLAAVAEDPGSAASSHRAANNPVPDDLTSSSGLGTPCLCCAAQTCMQARHYFRKQHRRDWKMHAHDWSNLWESHLSVENYLYFNITYSYI